MEALIQYFVANLDKGLWTAFLTLAVYFVLKKEPFKLITYYTDRKDKHYDFARTLLDNDKITAEAREFLRESLEKGAFLRYYGITADSQMRIGLLELHKKHVQIFNWTHIRRAYPYIRLKEGHITIEVRWHDHALRWIVTALSIFAASYSILVILIAVLSRSKANSLQFLGLMGSSLLLLVAAMCFASLNWPYHAARRIDREVRNSNR